MIPANELRLGNIVWVFKGYWTIEPPDFRVVDDALMPYEPIPLTPEILEAAGFEEVQNGWGIALRIFEGYVLICYLFNCFPLVLEIDGNRMPLHEIKYLHQLQNIYFALTSKELTFNTNIQTR